MRDLTESELRFVSGGIVAGPRPTQPPVIKVIVRVLEAILRRLEGGPVRVPVDPRQKVA